MNAEAPLSPDTAVTPDSAQPAPIRPIPVRLTVNGQVEDVLVPPRTQLAEILRDHLNLTATHLACEQGVCGACTVMIDGKPMRSCLTFAQDCNDARIETLEGWQGDALMDQLRAAFTRNHALQCGFCTPGMLATARDLVERLDSSDEGRIRNELSGNLCRCTGYVGIVASIREVIDERIAAGVAGTGAAMPKPATPAGFAAFDAQSDPAPQTAEPVGETTMEDGWTVVRRTIPLSHPVDAVWAHFRDLPAVARCLPGAALSEVEGDRFAGHVGVKFGPISARFEGEGTFSADESSRKGRVTGRGKDRGGQSNVEGALAYEVRPGAAPDTSEVDVSFRFRIEGMLGQFNRPELVNGLVDYILGEFVANCDAVLSGDEVRKSKGVSLWAVARAVLAGFFKRS